MENTNVNLFEMIAARALHFMRINCDMEYVDIANELGIDVQEVLNLIGPDSYDDSDIMLEATEEVESDVDVENTATATEDEAVYGKAEYYEAAKEIAGKIQQLKKMLDTATAAIDEINADIANNDAELKKIGQSAYEMWQAYTKNDALSICSTSNIAKMQNNNIILVVLDISK